MTTLEARPNTALLVVDVQSDMVRDAHERGYDTLLVRDAHTTEDCTRWGAPPPAQVIAHTNFYWSCEEAPGRSAGTASTADVRLRT
ncbi:MAG TPA: hypothetical protein VMB91_04480 [Solirubrobacteraceae bacterium]|nr:hypothetical protein [Solirubrobacteraceae bacterium]